jgi:hypothetical protein
MVDKHVREAAEGQWSQTMVLPSTLQCQLPASVTAIKAFRKTNIIKRWNKIWTVSPYYSHLKKIDTSLPSWHTYKMLSSLLRRATSILIQLHTGHVRLNVFCERLGLSTQCFALFAMPLKWLLTIFYTASITITRGHNSDRWSEKQLVHFLICWMCQKTSCIWLNTSKIWTDSKTTVIWDCCTELTAIEILHDITKFAGHWAMTIKYKTYYTYWQGVVKKNPFSFHLSPAITFCQY